MSLSNEEELRDELAYTLNKKQSNILRLQSIRKAGRGGRVGRDEATGWGMAGGNDERSRT